MLVEVYIRSGRIVELRPSVNSLRTNIPLMPNAFVYVALLCAPAVVFFLCRTLPQAHAVVAALVGGYLLLPHGVGFDLPFLPLLGKDSIPALALLVLLPIVGRSGLTSPPPRGGNGSPAPRAGRRSDMLRGSAPSISPSSPSRGGLWIEWVLIIGMLVVSPALTAVQNAEPLVYGLTVLPGLSAYDGLSTALSAATALLPYFLARRYLGSPDAQVLLLKGLAAAGALYSLLALVEMRLSPQISNWVYGYLAQAFNQAVRDGGYRPVVFLQHGLWLAIFFAMAAVASLTVWKQVHARKWLLTALWLAVILAFSRSLGALAIAAMCLPLVLVLGARSQVVAAAFIAGIIVLYPAVRGANVIPLAEIAESVEAISAERAGSLAFRLRNEDELLAKANEKPLSGWGGWGRSRVFDASGKDTSITDGVWVITIGGSGWVGYVAQFGLLALPVMLQALGRRRRDATVAAAGLCIVLCVNLVDMIPNATLTPITWMVAGALMGGLRHATAPTISLAPGDGRGHDKRLRSSGLGYARRRDSVGS